ncbi:hypothetical protein COCNU_14G000330 [Cocos nucifera]|uniref:AB hydrolase-1 domain-containing protein n=1 Tax=Cocos nucifera TaxID=13894 RepID=A0A8K0IU92_COCNU|nr:hypothetical protein COCNU_14G000330 [Cocos nucifera]
MAAGGKGNLERIRRGLRTAFFMLTMVASLLVSSAPVLVTVGDVTVSLALASRFACARCYSVRGHLERYGFKSSLMDIPLVSIVRSLAITCVYSLCDIHGLSYGPYLGTVTVLTCKNVFFGCHKVPRSPTPCGRSSKSDSETKRKTIVHDEGDLPISFLADTDSLFIACHGLTVHYKLRLSESPCSHSLASLPFCKSSPDASLLSLSSAKLKLEWPLTIPSKSHYHLKRSFSNQFQNSSLYAPLLAESATPPPFYSDEIPALSLDDGKSDGYSSSSVTMGTCLEDRGKLAVVLVHGFGGGAFSWRHVISVLAQQIACTVVGFDRPGWGLTSRPRRKDWEGKQLPNPYMLESQVDLLISFCLEMGFSSVVLVGHDDGGLLALKAAEKIHGSGQSASVLTCKNVFFGCHKVPRSPTPCGRSSKSDSETKRKTIVHDEGDLPISFLADTDSLFIACHGLTVHYKLRLSESPCSHSLASLPFCKSSPDASLLSLSSAKLKLEWPLTIPSKSHYHLKRSFSNQFQNSSLYAPLLAESATPPPFYSDEIPALSLDDGKSDGYSSSSVTMGTCLEDRGKLAVVLVHGFGGGAFSWRHVMSVLAQQIACTVVAFDRPGWGLTSRPRRKDWEGKQLPNPYMLESQVDLLISFCLEMGFSSVVLVGHDDGGLLALKAAEKIHGSGQSASKSCEWNAQQMFYLGG